MILTNKQRQTSSITAAAAIETTKTMPAISPPFRLGFTVWLSFLSKTKDKVVCN